MREKWKTQIDDIIGIIDLILDERCAENVEHEDNYKER